MELATAATAAVVSATAPTAQAVCIGCTFTTNVIITGGAVLVLSCTALGVACLVSETVRETMKEVARETAKVLAEEVVRPVVKKVISWLEWVWRFIVGPSTAPGH